MHSHANCTNSHRNCSHSAIVVVVVNIFSDVRPYSRNETVEQQPEADYIEKVVCDENDVGENEMKQVALDEDSKVLLVKQNGVLSAIGTKCSHYGALLSTGALSEGRVRCPWHGI